MQNAQLVPNQKIKTVFTSARWSLKQVGGGARAREYSRVPSTPPERAVPFEWRRIVKTKAPAAGARRARATRAVPAEYRAVPRRLPMPMPRRAVRLRGRPGLAAQATKWESG